MARQKIGRTKGRRTKGYFYRTGRGWYTKDRGRFVPLLYEDGSHIKDTSADERDVREAHARFLLHTQSDQPGDSRVTILDVCLAYLDYAKQNGAAKTHSDRADTLFDFCFGIPPEFRSYSSHAAIRNGEKKAQRFTTVKKQDAESKRIHAGYRDVRITDLRMLDIDQWLNAHTTWTTGGRRSRIQAVKRALNYARERGLIAANPIRGYKTPKAQARVTYITPEQEAALLKHARPSLGFAIRVCIRTGARFGTEFTRVTRQHILDHGDRMEWRFKPSEIKNRRMRIIRITDPAIIEIVRERIELHKSGPIFRSASGKPWSKTNLSQRFRFLKYKLQRMGVEFDPDCCMYSCRHTYAKRILDGYWNGKPTNTETLARLMGNTAQVCRDHYLQWSVLDHEFLWSAA